MRYYVDVVFLAMHLLTFFFISVVAVQTNMQKNIAILVSTLFMPHVHLHRLTAFITKFCTNTTDVSTF